MTDPFAALNSLPHAQVGDLTAGCQQRGPRLVRRVVNGVSFTDVQRGRELIDFGQDAGAYDSPANQRERFRVISSLPNRQHTGIVLLDRQIHQVSGSSRRRRIASCLIFAAGLGIASLMVIAR